MLGAGGDFKEIEAAYAAMSAKADKLTLKLYFQFLKSSKLERAFDAIKRLHLEASYDIAVKAADSMGLRKLSDRIITFKELRFPLQDEPFDDMDHEERIGYSSFSTRQDEQGYVSPEFNDAPKNLKRKENDFDDVQSNSRSQTVRIAHNQTDLRNRIETTKEKQRNPFAKKKIESPAKAPASPSRKSPVRKPQLSRNATFSAESRKKSMVSKIIL